MYTYIHLQVVLHDQLGEIIPHHFTTNTSLPLHLLHPSTLYTFSVRAYNSEGVGPYCNEPSEFTTNSSGKGQYACNSAHMYSTYVCSYVPCHYLYLTVVAAQKLPHVCWRKLSSIYGTNIMCSLV